MSVPKIIAKKEIGDIVYELGHWPGDDKYVIYKKDRRIMKQGSMAHRILEVGVFDTEKEARDFLRKLGE